MVATPTLLKDLGLCDLVATIVLTSYRNYNVFFLKPNEAARTLVAMIEVQEGLTMKFGMLFGLLLLLSGCQGVPEAGSVGSGSNSAGEKIDNDCDGYVDEK